MAISSGAFVQRCRSARGEGKHPLYRVYRYIYTPLYIGMQTMSLYCRMVGRLHVCIIIGAMFSFILAIHAKTGSFGSGEWCKVMGWWRSERGLIVLVGLAKGREWIWETEVTRRSQGVKPLKLPHALFYLGTSGGKFPKKFHIPPKKFAGHRSAWRDRQRR